MPTTIAIRRRHRYPSFPAWVVVLTSLAFRTMYSTADELQISNRQRQPKNKDDPSHDRTQITSTLKVASCARHEDCMLHKDVCGGCRCEAIPRTSDIKQCDSLKPSTNCTDLPCGVEHHRAECHEGSCWAAAVKNNSTVPNPQLECETNDQCRVERRICVGARDPCTCIPLGHMTEQSSCPNFESNNVAVSCARDPCADEGTVCEENKCILQSILPTNPPSSSGCQSDGDCFTPLVCLLGQCRSNETEQFDCSSNDDCYLRNDICNCDCVVQSNLTDIPRKQCTDPDCLNPCMGEEYKDKRAVCTNRKCLIDYKEEPKPGQQCRRNSDCRMESRECTFNECLCYPLGPKEFLARCDFQEGVTKCYSDVCLLESGQPECVKGACRLQSQLINGQFEGNGQIDRQACLYEKDCGFGTGCINNFCIEEDAVGSPVGICDEEFENCNDDFSPPFTRSAGFQRSVPRILTYMLFIGVASRLCSSC